MQTNLMHSEQSVSHFRPSIFGPEPSRLTVAPTPTIKDTQGSSGLGWSTKVPLGFVILSTLTQTSQPNTDFYARATMVTADTASLQVRTPVYAPVQQKSRYLTIEEQRVFHKALLRSARTIRKAKKILSKSN